MNLYIGKSVTLKDGREVIVTGFRVENANDVAPVVECEISYSVWQTFVEGGEELRERLEWIKLGDMF